MQILWIIKLSGRRFRSRFTRRSLLSPANSPWACVRACGDDPPMMHMTSLDISTFEKLLVPFTANLKRIRNRKRHKKRMLEPEACLGLVLHYMTTCGADKQLQLAFGVGQAVVSREKWDGITALFQTLTELPEAGIIFPNKVRPCVLWHLRACPASNLCLICRRTWTPTTRP